jgi:hypothetical protein
LIRRRVNREVANTNTYGIPGKNNSPGKKGGEEVDKGRALTGAKATL